MDNIYQCTKCNKKYKKKGFLDKHYKLCCITENDNIKKNEELPEDYSNNEEFIKITNEYKNKMVNLTSYHQKWNTFHLSINDKIEILKNKYIFTFALERILDNDENLNVKIDDENNRCFVYLSKLLVIVKLDSFIDFTMVKLYKHICTFCEELIENVDNEILINALDRTIVKFNMYKLNIDDKVKDDVKKYIIEIYNNKYIQSHHIINNVVLSHGLVKKNENKEETI